MQFASSLHCLAPDPKGMQVGMFLFYHMVGFCIAIMEHLLTSYTDALTTEHSSPHTLYLLNHTHSLHLLQFSVSQIYVYIFNVPEIQMTNLW